MKKWETELQSLRESNARLSTALQESAASIEHWKKQFSACKEENDQLRGKVAEHGTAELPSSQMLPPWLFLGALCSFWLGVLADGVVLEREVDGESRQLLPSAHSGQGGGRGLPRHVKFPTLGFGRFRVSRACCLGGKTRKVLIVGLLLHIPFKAH